MIEMADAVREVVPIPLWALLVMNIACPLAMLIFFIGLVFRDKYEIHLKRPEEIAKDVIQNKPAITEKL